jgi:aromatic-amino-acid transaminase
MLGDAVPLDRVVGVQTPGGTGAVRLASDLAARAGSTRAWLGLPSWPNHEPIFRAAGLAVETYDYFEIAQQTVRFEAMIQALGRAGRGDVVLLQGCCHNPTGADLTPEQWSQVAGLIEQRGLLPLIDLAYAGLGHGLEQDSARLRKVLARVPEGLLAVSCSKNFGLYRERTGAAFAIAGSDTAAQAALSNLLGISRANYSMPPDHGAAIVRTILDDPELKADWRRELDGMRERIARVRNGVAGLAMVGGVDLSPIGRELGMFSMLPLNVEQVRRLKTDFAVYMAESGRANLAGLRTSDIDHMADALKAVLG